MACGQCVWSCQTLRCTDENALPRIRFQEAPSLSGRSSVRQVLETERHMLQDAHPTASMRLTQLKMHQFEGLLAMWCQRTSTLGDWQLRILTAGTLHHALHAIPRLHLSLAADAMML